MIDELFEEPYDQSTDIESDNQAERQITPSPILDGSQVLRHDGYDVQAFRETLVTYAKLGELVHQARRQLITAPALIADLFWSFIKRAPEIAPVAPLTPAYAINQTIITQVLGTVEWEQVRSAGTVGDVLNSALATLGVANKAIKALDQTTIDQVNHVHELESGAAGLFAQAEALDDLAAQAEGDRAAQLFQQAQDARQEAEERAAEAARLQEGLDADTERIEDATRRAARNGLAAAEAEIDAANAAINTFGGGYGPGAGLSDNQMTTREKIALAQRVGQSKRLKQIAAVCGRFTRIALNVQYSKVQHPPDEITSITIGRELGRILPSEIALLTDPTLEDLFFLKYAEGRLMQYDLVGNERQGQGPLIVALDSSGSMTEDMGGISKEVWSKAVTLALLAIARLQGRDMAVLHFSDRGQLLTFHFPKGKGSHTDIISCIDHFYNGGTVFEPWMAEALTLVDQAAYDKADVICISDGLASIAAQARADWQHRREERGMRAYAVLIGTNQGAGALASISDALLTLDNFAGDMPVLETIFAL